MTHLCVPIFVTDLAQARRDIAAAAEAGADLVELRIDKLHDINTLMLLLDDRILPAIVTCRSELEGGFSELDDDKRLSRLEEALTRGAQLVDLELQTVRKTVRIPAAIPSRLILSAHDFAGRPRELGRIIAEMNATPAKVNKIVWRAENIVDNLEALKLLKQPSRPTVALCMGEAGLPSRILARKFAAFLTFAALGHESATAPGQVPIAEMKNLYRWDDLGPETKVFGVVAHPVKQSMSPAIHNAAFKAVGYDGVYLPLLVEPGYDSFKAFMDGFVGFEELHLSGLSVTIPHKEDALRYLKEKGGQIEHLAEQIGAVNTIAIRRSPGAAPALSGRNTDYAAILDCITSELAIGREKLKGLKVAVLGAGGTARAAVAALAHHGAELVVSNRTHPKAQALADEFGRGSAKVLAMPMDQLLASGFRVLINTTSVGMFPNIGDSPLGDGPLPFSRETLVFDTIYNPMKTRLLTQAEGLGARTISGVEMFVRQAAAQFEIWTEKAAPVRLMRQVISERLGLPVHRR